jgi:hypothetical protein
MTGYIIETQSGDLLREVDCPVVAKQLCDLLPSAWRVVRARDGVVLAEHSAARRRYGIVDAPWGLA